MQLRVEKVRATDANVRLGSAWTVDDDVLVGRDASCDLVISSPDVSRRHFRITVRPDGYWLDNLSSRGTWVNQEPVDAGVQLHDGDFVQLGGILLRVVDSAAPTRSAPGVMSIEGLDSVPRPGAPETNQTPLFTYDPAGQTLTLLSHHVVLQPMSLQAVSVLLEAPGRWVSFDVLIECLWPDSVTGTPGYVSKYLSYARQSLAEIVDEDPAARARLHRSILDHADGYSDIDDLDPDDSRALLRELIKSRRRVGFRLLVGARDVAVVGC